MEKTTNTMGTASPDLSEKQHMSDTGPLSRTVDPNREESFMTRNGLNLESFKRRTFAKLSDVKC